MWEFSLQNLGVGETEKALQKLTKISSETKNHIKSFSQGYFYDIFI